MSIYDPNHIPVKNYFLIGVKLVLTDQEGKILLLKRSAKSSNPHNWDLPGGAVDAGESLEIAINRELYEETGLKLTGLQALGSVHKIQGADEAIIIGFTAITDNTNVTLSWEHESYQWVGLEEIPSLGLRDLHTQFIEYYKNKKDS